MKPETLAEVLAASLARQQFTPRRLAESTDIPEDTIKGWLSGRGKSIREWHRALLLASTLHLNAHETRRLFAAAKVPLTALGDHAIIQAQAQIRSESMREALMAWHRDLQPGIDTAEEDSAPHMSSTGAPDLLEPAIATPPIPPKERFQPWTRWSAFGLIFVLIAGLGLTWSVYSSKPLAFTSLAWGIFSDQDLGGHTVVQQFFPPCHGPASISEAAPIPGCIEISGEIRDSDGYLGTYYVFRTDEQPIDLSGMDAIIFNARGTGLPWHVGLEIRLSATEQHEYHAVFTPTATLQTFNIPLADFKPFEDAPPLDLARITTVSWAINGGPQSAIKLTIDQAAFLPKR